MTAVGGLRGHAGRPRGDAIHAHRRTPRGVRRRLSDRFAPGERAKAEAALTSGVYGTLPDDSEHESADEEDDSDRAQPEQAFENEPHDRQHRPNHEQYDDNRPHALRLRFCTIERRKNEQLTTRPHRHEPRTAPRPRNMRATAGLPAIREGLAYGRADGQDRGLRPLVRVLRAFRRHRSDWNHAEVSRCRGLSHQMKLANRNSR